MFIRVNTTPNSPRRSVQIVESRREGTKVRTKILRHVGIAMDEEELGALKALAQDTMAKMIFEAKMASPQGSFFPPDLASIQAQVKKGRPKKKPLAEVLPLRQVTLEDIVEEKRIVEGVEDIAGRVYDDLGFSSLLSSKRQATLLRDTVLARLVAPHSKRKLQKLLSDRFDRHHDLDAVYRMMDALEPKIDAVKQAVFQRTQALLPQPLTLLFFDVTTLYFESTTTDTLRKFGYSKDHRFTTTQLVLALATDSNGLPLGYELFEGNKAEVATLVACLDTWQTTLAIKEVCFVGDRAMFSEANMALLEERGYTYIVAAKLRSMSQAVKEQLREKANYTPQEFGEELGWVGEFGIKGRRLIVSYKASRADHDARNREQILNKVRKLLTRSTGAKATLGSLISNKGIKKYTRHQGKSQVDVDEAKVAEDASWDGLHGVITNIKDREPGCILGMYKRLWVIEEAFRINKHTLKMRPIYHHKPERIKAHIALCYMSYAVLRHLQHRVYLTQKISVTDIMEELWGIQASIYVHKKTGDRYRVPGHVTHKAGKIYKAFGLVRDTSASVYSP